MARPLFSALLALAALTALPACAEEEPDETAGAWQTIEPGGETLCAPGTPYSFHVRQGIKEKLLIFFNGGGACWSGDLCDTSVDPTPYVAVADADHNNPRLKGGVFDLNNSENPFAGWSQVFVSYCTGDVHLGAADRTYTKKDGSEVTIHHRGKVNAQAALDWTYDHFEAPERIFVAGGSAGSIASPYYAALVKEHYPDAAVVQFGGGSGGYRMGPLKPTFDAWGLTQDLPDWDEMEILKADDANFEDLYRAAAQRHPEIAFHQYNTAYDEAQVGFLRLFGEQGDLWELMQLNLEDLKEDVPLFHSYTAGGTFHTILRYEEFYQYKVDGVRIADWVADAAMSKPVKDISCETVPDGCKTAPGGLSADEAAEPATEE